jgi:hypothetical protein
MTYSSRYDSWVININHLAMTHQSLTSVISLWLIDHLAYSDDSFFTWLTRQRNVIFVFFVPRDTKSGDMSGPWHFFSNRGWAPRLWVGFGRWTGPSTQFNSLNKVGCLTSSMGWIGTLTSSFVQLDDHSNNSSVIRRNLNILIIKAKVLNCVIMLVFRFSIYIISRSLLNFEHFSSVCCSVYFL